MSNNQKQPVNPVSGKPKKKGWRLPLIIGGVAVVALIILAVGAGAVYYFFFYTPQTPTAKIAELPPVAGPDVMFLQPESGTFASVGDSIQVVVSAQDVALVSRIDLWIDDTLAISLPSPDPAGINPLILSFPLVAVEPGTYSLVARAYNTRGAMTESPAITMWVSVATAVDSADQPIQYIVGEGDTLESIAGKTGSSVDEIKSANSGIQNVNPGQNIAIPHPPLPQPPQPPANPAAGAGGAMGALPGLLPAALPGGLQDNLPSIDPGQQQLAPNILPDPKTILDISPAPVKAPQLVQIIPTGCKVEITWTDKADNETGFVIYRRMVPNEAISKAVGMVAANVTTFVDTVPFPANYQYSVEALGSISMLPQNQADILQIQQVINTARSNPGTANVLPATSCIAELSTMKHIYFQIESLFVNDPKFTGVALWYSINDSAPRRVPANQGSFPNPGGASFSGKAYIPLPTAVYANPDQPIIVKIWAAGYTDASWVGDAPGPENLGLAFSSHLVKDIEGKDGQYFHRFRFSNMAFEGNYLIAVTDLVYGGDYSSTQLPAPTNLKIAENPIHNLRDLVWDWSGDPNLLEGYVIYRSYSCIGRETEIRAPVVIGKNLKGYSIPMIYEPQGCAYSYQVSALGQLGESKRSDPLTGKTEDTFGIAYVTFKDIKINNLDNPDIGVIEVRAGNIEKSSTPLWLQKGIYSVSSLFLEGKSPNNTTTVVLSPKESLTISFTLSGFRGGILHTASICNKAIVVNWDQPNSTHTLKSNDGNCEMTVDITTVPPAAGASGQRALPQADLEIRSLVTIGNKLYINIHNNGPQDLQASQVVIFNNWGIGVCDGAPLYKATVDGPFGLDRYTVDIKASSSIWLHISDRYDDGYARYGIGQVEGECYNFFTTGVDPLSTSERFYISSYIDPNLDNNNFRIKMQDVGPMQ